ncbi:MAG: hypothetical protein H7061_06340 [Bdellovibrionaceae bacterium]|nr:hypothetical protein [Bdellovibrio sp.]
MIEKNLEKKWLVKSENRILGPYHIEQIEDLLKKKQISLIDEVRDMETRWLYIRENPRFKSIVEEIRKDLDAKSESTKTFQSFSKTEESYHKTNASLPQFTEVDVQEASLVSETKERGLSNDQSENSLLKEKAKVYGLPQDQYFQKRVASSNRKKLVYALMFIGFIASIVFTVSYYQKRAIQKQEEEWAAQVRKYHFLGLDQKVVELYAQLPDSFQKKILPDIISIYPVLEANHLVQLKDIESLSRQNTLTLQQKMYVQLIYFWSALQSQNLMAANEALIKARAVDPSSTLVVENQALLELRQSKFLSSFETFMKLYKDEPMGRYLVGALQSYVGLPTEKKAALSAALTAQIEKHISVYYDYKKELLLGQMGLARWNKNDLLFKVSWNQFLNTPVQFSALYKKPSLLVPLAYQWTFLEEYKIVVRSALSPEDVVLFEIHNYLESSQVSAAQQYAANNMGKIKDKSLKQQITLLTLNSQSRHNEIIALEKTNQLDPQSELNHLLFALNKIQADPPLDISPHLQFFKDHQLIFYNEWMQLAYLLKTKQHSLAKSFIRDHLISVTDFTPVIEAKGLTE